MLKKLMIAGWSLLLVFCANADVQRQPQRYLFATYGNDCYADGSLVMEGEVYAVVWRAAGTETSPLVLPTKPPARRVPSADGSYMVYDYFPNAIRWEDEGVEYAGCSDTIINDDGRLSFDLERNGTWTVYLLDTRYLAESGELMCGFDPAETNIPRCINSCVAIEGLTNFNIGECPASPVPTGLWINDLPPNSEEIYAKCGGVYDEELEMLVPTVASDKTFIPADCPVPRVSGIVVTNGIASLSVTNAASYLSFGVSMADTVGAADSSVSFVTAADGRQVQQGNGGESVMTWDIPVGNAVQQFFKVLPRSILDIKLD